jgi:ATP-dependent DNA helicase RecQ
MTGNPAHGAARDPAGELRRHFGHPSFRPGQEAIVQAVLDGRDVLAVMPTGSGKSIGYQLPALLLPGVTLVVSPLIALMKDQVDELNRRGMAAAAINSVMSPADRREALDAALRGRLKLLYVAPERFASDRFMQQLGEIPVARFAVDEAHCVSEWGHDFRPDYRRLQAAAARCRRSDGAAGRPPVVAFTATATPEVRDDIVALLGQVDPAVFVTGFDRPNLSMDVRAVSGPNEKHRLLPGIVGTRRALVYASTRKNAERAAESLREAGIPADPYHAGLDDRERSRVQEGFADGAIRVVCATNAFGMGIDRPDIDLVVHFEIPGSLEAYYQEIGRAGRDGRPADVVLLWNYADVRTREFFIEKDAVDDGPGPRRAAVDPVERERRRDLDRRKLARMVAYADTTACLRSALLRYFGERDVPPCCGNCGPCRRRTRLTPEEVLRLRKILSGVARAGERFGRRKIAAMLAGRTEELPDALTRLTTTGILRDEGLEAVERWIDRSVASGLLRASDDKYRTLSLTRDGRDVMTGRASEVFMNAPAPPPAIDASRGPRLKRRGSKAAVAGRGDRSVPPDERLIDSLRAWRRATAAERSVPPYVVLHDRTVAALAAARPATLDELADVPGIGPAKLAAYGPQLIDLLKQPPIDPAPIGSSAPGSPPR